MNKSPIVIWLLFLVAIFAIGYLTTHLLVTRVMADLVVKQNQSEPVYLEVKPVPNNAVQTDQYTPIQGAATPIGKEL